jgi:hypothetical protein
VNLFREKGTLDELGIGVIRDGFADQFFPGTSTLQTRARYLLFIPWVFLQLEQERVPSAQFDRRARHAQADLVQALLAGRESEGVIGPILEKIGANRAQLEKIIEARLGRRQIGFNPATEGKKGGGLDSTNVFGDVEPDDLLRFGLIPELVGRLPVTVPLESLDESALVRILKEPKNALTKQYAKLFELEDVQITFEESALKAIATKAIERGTGARGLRAILEEMLLDTMFDLPGRDDVIEVRVTEATVVNKTPPLLELSAKRQKKEA